MCKFIAYENHILDPFKKSDFLIKFDGKAMLTCVYGLVTHGPGDTWAPPDKPL